MTENVRPSAVMCALKWLMKNSELYSEAGIRIDHQWKEKVESSTNEKEREFVETNKHKNSSNSNCGTSEK